MLKTETTNEIFARVLLPEDEAYQYLLSHFKDISGQPPLTAVAIKALKEQAVGVREFLIARYALEKAFKEFTCLATNHGAIDGDVFFEQRNGSYVMTDNGHYHALGHGVLACRKELLNDDNRNGDRLFEDKDGKVLVFTGVLPAAELVTLIAELDRDLKALWQGVIQGRIAELVFGPARH